MLRSDERASRGPDVVGTVLIIVFIVLALATSGILCTIAFAVGWAFS